MTNDLAERVTAPITFLPIFRAPVPASDGPRVVATPIIQKIGGVDVLGETPSNAISNTLAAIAEDGGTGAHIPTPAEIPHMDAIFGPSEEAVMAAASVANAGTWESATRSLAPNAEMLHALAQSGAGGGVNLQLGPQLGFAPIDNAGGGGSGNGGGMAVFLLLALGIVGGLVYYHFRKKKAPSGSETA